MASFALADNAKDQTTEIEVEVRFIEIRETTPETATFPRQLDGSGTQTLAASDITTMLSSVERSGSVDILAAPRLKTQSGANATIKVVTEYRYPTDVEIRRVAVTNGTDIVHGVAVVPSGFQTRDVGITLNVTPVFDAKRNMIDLELMAELVSEPIWKEYTATYEGADGTKQTVSIAQPFFHTRQVNPTLSMHNNSTVATGGMITTGTKRVDERVPILGSIPWLGRLFRSSHEVQEKRHLLVTIAARTVDDTQ